MTLFKRGRVWWFDFWFNGQRHQKSTKETNRNKASTIAAGYRTALANRRVGIVERPPVHLFGEAMKAFLEWSKVEHKQHPRTYQRYKVSSKALSAFTKFNGKPIDQITPALIEDYKAHRAKQSGKKTKRPITPATINRELACLKAMYFHALKDRHDFGNPVSGVDFLPENNEQNRVLTFEEQRKYLAVASGTLKDVASLILETGMRPEEVYRIRVENVYPDQGYLFNPFGKTKAAKRKIPLNAAALAIVTRRLKAAKGAHLFPHRKDRDKPMLKVNNAHSTALRKSTVRAFRIYDLRHTWATRAAESGQVDPTTLAALLGHSKLNMVMRYAHPQEEHQAEAVKKLAAANAAKEIAEFEKRQNRSQTPVSETVPTVSPTVSQNPGNFSEGKNRGKSNQIN
jgi:integrase